MRKLLTLVSAGALIALGASMGAAQEGEQAAAGASRTYDLAGFAGISVVGPHHVVVSVGPGFSIRADGPQQTLADTAVEVEDGQLKIHPIDDDRWERRCRDNDDGDRRGRWRCWGDYEPATFYITLPSVETVALVGGGDMRIDRVEGSEFSASLAGSGDLDVAALRVDDARLSIAGSGNLVARGSARHSRVSIAGSGNLRARDMTSDEASISIAGSGDVALTVQNDARVSMVGGGDVEISGPARCAVSRFGGGRVRCNGETVTS